ncbi:CD209 antigen-like protein C isoform X2 [Paroedura picta]|uniref:CD209 antigen-like protein C isoform X2 n=1 Tax=Paroedura picta TaxID=143630 RepID=UPI004057B39F
MPSNLDGGGSAGLKVAPIINLFVVVVTVILFCSALGMIIFYYAEQRNRTYLLKVVCNIRNIITQPNQAYREMTGHFLQKVKEGWVSFEGHLYFFNDELGFYSDAQKDCEKRNAILAYVTSTEEEDFLEEMVSRIGSPHWLGLRRIRRKWFWITGKPAEAPLLFWNSRKPGPTTDIHKTCVEMIPWSRSKRRRWQDAYCNDPRNWICKLAPEPIYEI